MLLGLNHSILWCLLLFKVIIGGEVGDQCAPNGENTTNGTCKLSIDCQNAISFVKSIGFHPFSRCGFSDMIEIVCCPNEYIQPPTAEKRPKPTTNVTGDERYGIKDRIADIECQKIVASNLPPLQTHIIGGTNASLGEFPHMVSLGYKMKSGKYDFLCGGSLISDSYVLTAAHCVDRKAPTIARMGVVYLGEGQWNSDTDFGIQQVIKHPNYTSPIKYNDLVLLKLAQAVVFSSNLNPICLYTKNEDPSVSLTVSGWGVTNTTRKITSKVLQKAAVLVVSRSKCGQDYRPQRPLPQGITDEQICAGDPNGSHDACQGDSGGPLQALTNYDGFWRLVGVTSFGRGCGSPVPGVYTRVSRYLDWIESVVWSDRQ